MVVAAVVVQVSSQCTVGNVHNSPCILIQYQIWGEGGKKKTSGAFGLWRPHLSKRLGWQGRNHGPGRAVDWNIIQQSQTHVLDMQSWPLW